MQSVLTVVFYIKEYFNSQITVKERFNTMRSIGSCITITTLSVSVQAFVPHALPLAKPALAPSPLWKPTGWLLRGSDKRHGNQIN